MVSDKEKQKAQDSDHWERKNKWGEPWDALSHCQGWKTKTELSCLAGLRRQSSDFGKARATRIYRTEYRTGGSSRDLQWSHLSLWVMACQMWENYQGKEKNHQKRVSETVTTVYMGLGIFHVLRSQTEKISFQTRHQEECRCRKLLPQKGIALNKKVKLAID